MPYSRKKYNPNKWILRGHPLNKDPLQALSQRIGERRSNVENSLTTRSDLVTQLFEIAKENGVHEAQIHTAVAQLETHPGGLASAGIEGLLNVMTPINRAYPDLKASDGYTEVMTQLQQVEATIALFQAASGEKIREAIFNVSRAIADKSTEMGGALIDESRQISARTAKTVMARGRDIGQYGRKKLGQRTGADEAETADENHERDTTGKFGDTE